MRLPCRGGTQLASVVFTLFTLLLCVDKCLSRTFTEADYIGPVVCKGTRPLFVDKSIIDDDAFDSKPYFEPYWEQFYEHVRGCEIIIGNLIIPHMRKVPFDEKKITDAVKSIVEVTGYIYIYDVEVDIDFESLVVIHGYELFTYPWDMATDEKHKNEKFALFFDRVAADSIRFPKLKFIKNGVIGFKSTPKMCAFKEDWQALALDDWFEVPHGSVLQYGDLVKIFKKSGKKETEVFSACPAKSSIKCDSCAHCFGNLHSQCQQINRRDCYYCKSTHLTNTCAGDMANVMCCDNSCRGGCTVGHQAEDDLHTAQCVACKDSQYLLWQSADKRLQRKCVDSCDGLIIEEARICLHQAKACPDNMFIHSVNKCSYQCPQGMEYDPAIDNADVFLGNHYYDYWSEAATCRPCRMRFVDNNFVDDCGIGCVLPYNSLSFFSILNIVPGYNDMKEWTHTKFAKVISDEKLYSKLKRCRYLYGTVKIDQFSVGYPKDKVRLNSRYFDLLTEASSLYGKVVVQNTEGFWYVDMFRNLISIRKPRHSNRNSIYTDSVLVQYNSDLRTLDLQRLKFVDGRVNVHSNALYIPPRDPNDMKAFIFNQNENVQGNGQERTRSNKLISYDTGCKTKKGERIKAYYYKRCVNCDSEDIRWIEYKPEWRQLFYTCISQDECPEKRTTPTSKLYFRALRDKEYTCIPCSNECAHRCTDETPFTCFTDNLRSKELKCVNNLIDQFNLKACAPLDCPRGFYQDSNKKCTACHNACRMCNAAGDAATLKSGDKGCLGCGIIYPEFDPVKNSVTAVKCMNSGYAPRVNDLDDKPSPFAQGFTLFFDNFKSKDNLDGAPLVD